MRLFLTAFLILTSSIYAEATVYIAQAKGDWTTPATWGNAIGYPIAGDSVFIDGVEVTADLTNVAAQYIQITNSGNSALIVDGTITLTVAENIDVISKDKNKDMSITVTGSAFLDVGGDLNFKRIDGDNHDISMLLSIAQSGRVKIAKNLNVDYDNIGFEKGDTDILIADAGLLMVEGNVDLNILGGNHFTLNMTGEAKFINDNDFIAYRGGGKQIKIFIESDSLFHVKGDMSLKQDVGGDKIHFNMETGEAKVLIEGDLLMNSSEADAVIETKVKGANTYLSVRGNIMLTGQSDKDVKINLDDYGTLKIGGNFDRSPFGDLNMQNTTSLIFDGSGAQVIPCTNMPSSGNDEFLITNIYFESAPGGSLALEDTLSINTSLNLTNGILLTAPTKPLILEDNVEVIGGSSSAYVDGPLIKKGRTSGDFTFPVGNNNVYAPLRITEVTSESSAYVVTYLNCPPPFGGMASVSSISSVENWTMYTDDGSDVVNPTLTWSDANASGIADLNSLVVAYKTPTGDWTNMGNTGTTGGTGAGVGGSITGDALNCPPPFGGLALTFGSTDGTSLPVELSRFDVVEKDGDAKLEWETISEVAFSHFEIEKSFDAITFETIGMVSSGGNPMEVQQYHFYDSFPFYGITYYRLKEIDDDGSFTYSPIKSIKFSIDRSISIYPNPVVDQIMIEGLDMDSEMGMVEIYNQSGFLIYKEELYLESGKVQLYSNNVNIHNAGIYYILVTDAKGKQCTTLVKTKV